MSRRQRTAWVSAVAVAVLVAVGVLGAAVWQSNRPGDAAMPATATVDGAGLAVGDGPVAGNRLDQLDLTTLTGAIDAAAGQR